MFNMFVLVSIATAHISYGKSVKLKFKNLVTSRPEHDNTDDSLISQPIDDSLKMYTITLNTILSFNTNEKKKTEKYPLWGFSKNSLR